MCATVQDKTGKLVPTKSKAGEALELLVPSGGFYTMTGPGAGAGTLNWYHEVLPTDVDSIALIIDHCVSYDQQQEIMRHMAAQLCGRVQTPPASLPTPI